MFLSSFSINTLYIIDSVFEHCGYESNRKVLLNIIPFNSTVTDFLQLRLNTILPWT